MKVRPRRFLQKAEGWTTQAVAAARGAVGLDGRQGEPGFDGRDGMTVAQLNQEIERALARAQPALRIVSKSLAGLGRLVMGLSIIGALGVLLLIAIGYTIEGWLGLAMVAFALLPVLGWRVGRRAVAAAGLLGDPGRVLATVRASGQAGRDWLEQTEWDDLENTYRHPIRAVRAIFAARRAAERVFNPDVEGAAELWYFTKVKRVLTSLLCGVLSSLLLPIACVWGVTVLLI